MWIAAAFVALILLLLVTFYLGRGIILSKILENINRDRPGEVYMEQVRLLPLQDFPDAVLQFSEVNVYEHPAELREEGEEAFISLGEIYVSVGLADLLRGQLQVRDLKLDEGFIIYEFGADSISNLERALGAGWLSGKEKEDAGEEGMGIHLENIEFRNLSLIYKRDGAFANIRLHGLKSQVDYEDQFLRVDLGLDMDVINLRVRGISMDTRRKVQFDSKLLLDSHGKELEMEPSTLHLAGLELHAGGRYSFGADPWIDMEFRAVNTGLDLLNFLLLGILDMDEVQQSAEGNMSLEGSVKGRLEDEMPEVSISGSVKDVALFVQSIDREIRDISFDLMAGTGKGLDLSDGFVKLTNFEAHSDEGALKGHIRIHDLIKPEIQVDVGGSLDLQGMAHILKIESINELQGSLDVYADLRGSLDPGSDVFLDSSSIMTLDAIDVGFILGEDSISNLNGRMYIMEEAVGSQGLDLVYNGQKGHLSLEVSALIPYILGYNRDLESKMALRSDSIRTSRVLKDSSLTRLFGEDIRGLKFQAGARISKEEMDRFLKDDSIPELEFTLENFSVDLPAYANISRLKASLLMDADTLKLQQFSGMIGESSFHFAGWAENYQAVFQEKPEEAIILQGRLSAPLVRAEDLFVFNGDFLLPETYRSEYLEEFLLDASLRIPASPPVQDSVPGEFQMEIRDAAWRFRYYPLAFKDFRLQLERKGSDLLVKDFSGEVGQSSFHIHAELQNLDDSAPGSLGGKIELESELLDLNELLKYEPPNQVQGEGLPEGQQEAPRLDRISFPDMGFLLDIGELRYGENRIFGIRGDLRTSSEKILYLDHLETSVESGGSILMDGQFNVANADYYSFSADLSLKDIDLQDLNVELKAGDDVFRLDRNFAGLLSADGLAEIFLTPDLKLDMSTTTAMFNVVLRDGELNNFTPLYAAGKYLGSQELDSIRFSELYNRFTLIDSRIMIPLMVVESNVGQLLIEGEQALDGTYLYLLRIPTWLVREAAFGRLAGSKDENEDEIRTMRKGLFMKLTPWSDGEESGVRLGDKRDKYR